VKAPAASRPREQAKQQGGGEAGSFLWFAGPAARASQVVQDDMILDLAPEKIFFDWSSNQKMRFLLSHLPASPPPCSLVLVLVLVLVPVHKSRKPERVRLSASKRRKLTR
jgi:hypothetical protein